MKIFGKINYMGIAESQDILKTLNEIVNQFINPTNSQSSVSVANCPLNKESIQKIPSDECMYEIFDADTTDKKREAQVLIDSLRKTFKKYSIDTPEKQAMFLGQMKHETGGFKKFKEDADLDIVEINNKPYSIKGKVIEKVDKDGKKVYVVNVRERKSKKSKNKYTGKNEWRASVDSKKKTKDTNFESVELSQSEYKSMESSRSNYFQYLNQNKAALGGKIDNSKYFGEGAFHMTHYQAFKEYQDKYNEQIDEEISKNGFSEKTKIDLVNDPELVGKDPELIADSAGYFWQQKKINKIISGNSIDNSNIDKVTKVINGGLNGQLERRKEVEESYKILKNPKCSQANNNIPLA